MINKAIYMTLTKVLNLEEQKQQSSQEIIKESLVMIEKNNSFKVKKANNKVLKIFTIS